MQRGALKLQYIRTDEQIADILTKPLTASKFVYFRDKLGMAENASLAERECLFSEQHREPFSLENGTTWSGIMVKTQPSVE